MLRLEMRRVGGGLLTSRHPNCQVTFLGDGDSAYVDRAAAVMADCARCCELLGLEVRPYPVPCLASYVVLYLPSSTPLRWA